MTRATASLAPAPRLDPSRRSIERDPPDRVNSRLRRGLDALEEVVER